MAEKSEPNRAIDFLLEHANKYAQAKADRVHLEQFRKSKKAILMSECSEKAFAAKEMYAYSHPDYTQLLEGLREAVRIEEALRWRLTAAQLRVEVWRSENANNRNLDRTMR
ncbi:hypothetical protein [Ottowia sp. VDI28]|uniref:hypothetical protein n=1 Tax=Ottowia sp. VDI28 TaxID=3133968 RepID=UPI003C2B56F1